MPPRDVPFPLRGLDQNWAYIRQPEGTTPSCLNVRGYSADVERARGGSRPGLKRAYSTQIGGTNAIQWLGWLDYGHGDTVFYDDDFEYTGNTALTGQSDWTATGNSSLKVRNGYAYLSGTTTANVTVAYDNFGGDDWDDWRLETGIQWSYGTTGTVTFTVGASTMAIAATSTEVAAPGLGFTSALQFSWAGNAFATKLYGALMAVTGGALRVEALDGALRVFWDDAEIGSFAHPGGTPGAATIAMVKSNPSTGSWWPDSQVTMRLLDWHLTAITRPSTLAKKLVVINGNKVYAESAEGTMGVGATDGAGSTVSLAAPSLISATWCNGTLFIVDGSDPKYLRPELNKVVDWSPRKGELVPDCRGIVNWRNRVVLFNSTEHPHAFYMSRLDDPWDFDYGQDDALSAVASATFTGGRIGEPIRAMCPVSDDRLVIGCTRSLWVLRGDPMSGGWLTRLSDQVGIVSQNAWTTDENGNLYFLADEGLYVLPPGGNPRNLTSKRIPDLGNYKVVNTGGTGSAGDHYISLEYDADRHGLLIFITPHTSGTATHYFYDLRNDAFWPETYPNAVGPIDTTFYNATGTSYRKTLLGSRDGYLYELDDDRKYDQTAATGGTAGISSHVWMPLGRLGGGMKDATVNNVVYTMSADSDAATGGVYGAETMEALTGMSSAEVGSSTTLAAGRNYDERNRVAGGAHAVKLSNATAGRAWAMESIVVDVGPKGAARKA